MLTKNFATGTVLQAQPLRATASARSPPINNTGGGERELGPSYSLLGQLTLTQPFLRGAGSTLGLASAARGASSNRTASPR